MAIYNPQDIIYMRYFQKGKVLRVARLDTLEGLVLALYPTDNPDVFSGEAFHEVDDNSSRREIKRAGLKDKVWLALLEGKDIPEILKKYEPESLGAGIDDSYHYCKRGTPYEKCMKYRTFHIVSDEDEDKMLEEQARAKHEFESSHRT